MSEEKENPGIGPQPLVAVMTITMNLETAALSVNGPLAEKGLCYQMLELARDVVKDYRKPVSPIIPAGIMPMPTGRPGHG